MHYKYINADDFKRTSSARVCLVMSMSPSSPVSRLTHYVLSLPLVHLVYLV